MRSKRERFDKPPLCLTSANTHTIAMTTASASTPVKFPDDFDTRRLKDMSNLSAKDKFLALVGWRSGAMQAWYWCGWALLTPPTEGDVYATRVAEALKAAAPRVIHVDLSSE